MTRSERLDHVRSWRASGLSRAAYCRKHELKYGTFMSWFKLEQETVEEGKFVALSSVPATEGLVEVHFSNGIRVHYRGRLDGELIKCLQNA